MTLPLYPRGMTIIKLKSEVPMFKDIFSLPPHLGGLDVVFFHVAHWRSVAVQSCAKKVPATFVEGSSLRADGLCIGQPGKQVRG